MNGACVANKYRGESELPRPEGKPLQLRIGSQVICKAEAALDKPLAKILEDLEVARVTTMMTVLRLALVRKEPMSVEDTCELIDECGYEVVGTALKTALYGALGISVDAAKEGTANPPPAPTGENSANAS